MKIATLRSPRGTLIHAVRGEVLPLTSTTSMAETECGKEMKGLADYADSPDSLTCARCEAAVRATIADELTAMGQEIDVMEPAPVLSSPEVVREPRIRYSQGRARHGRIRQERADRRRRMKEAIRSGAI